MLVRAPSLPSSSDAGVGPTGQRDLLTASEFRVLECLLGSSLPEKQIAIGLHISPKTVRVHCHSIFRKFGVHSRLELIMRFLGRE